MAARLEDKDSRVRVSAVQALSKIAEKGDQQAIAAVVAWLEHQSLIDRIMAAVACAVQALSKIAEKRDQKRKLDFWLNFGCRVLCYICSLLRALLRAWRRRKIENH